MAIVNAARGGQPNFNPLHCDGDWPMYMAPYNGVHFDDTPPFNSHADGAYEQGFLTVAFPWIPNLYNTDAHRWQQDAMKGLKAVGDVFLTNWIPTRSYLDSVYYEVTRTDPRLDGVFIQPVAYRLSWDFTRKEYAEPVKIDEFTAELAAAGIGDMPLGTPQANDSVYGMARLGLDPTKKPTTFGHNIVKYDAAGAATAGFDDNFGVVLVGYQITQGDPAKIQEMWNTNFAVYFSGKLLAFESPSQVG